MKIKEIEELFTEAQKHRVIAHESVHQCLTHGPELVKRVREQDAENKALREAVQALIAAMCDQLKREKGLFHIPAHTMRYMWAQAIRKGRKALKGEA